MSQAVLILAHKDVPHVVELANTLQPTFKAIIHFDNKLALSDEDRALLEKHHVEYIQKYSVHWGAWSVCKAVLTLIEAALNDPEITHLHLISGQDWPVRKPETIFAFYEHDDHIYLNHAPAKGVKKTGEPLEWWQQYYFDYDKIPRQTIYGILYHRISLVRQTLAKTDKLEDLGIDLELFQGSQWADLTRESALYLTSYLTTHPEVRKMLETGFCSDEFLFQTILCNSPLKGKIVNNNHRFIKAVKQHGSLPAILDESNLDEIKRGNYHFARKIDEAHSRKLMDALPLPD